MAPISTPVRGSCWGASLPQTQRARRQGTSSSPQNAMQHFTIPMTGVLQQAAEHLRQVAVCCTAAAQAQSILCSRMAHPTVGR